MQSTSPRVAVSASAGTKVFTTTNNEGKVTFHVTTSATLPSTSSAGSTGTASTPAAQPTTPKKSAILARGVPPPVPPNKPVIPPKKTSSATGTTTTSVSGQTFNPLPVVISCSNNPQVTTVDHGRPISLEVHPLHKAGQIGSHQGVKFGITISKDKIQISSNPPQQQQGLAGDPKVREGAVMQVGDGVVDGSRADSQAHEVSDSSSAAPSLSPLLSPFSLALLEKELDDFQKLLGSMATTPNSSSTSPSSLSGRLEKSFFFFRFQKTATNGFQTIRALTCPLGSVLKEAALCNRISPYSVGVNNYTPVWQCNWVWCHSSTGNAVTVRACLPHCLPYPTAFISCPMSIPRTALIKELVTIVNFRFKPESAEEISFSKQIDNLPTCHSSHYSRCSKFLRQMPSSCCFVITI